MTDTIPVFQFVEQIISGNYSAAQTAIASADGWFRKLAAAQVDLPLSIVNVDIGTDAGVTWSATINPPSAPTEPDFSAQVPTAATTVAVTRPSGLTVGSAPSAVVDLTGQPTALTDPSFSDLPTLGTLPEITAVAPTMDVALLSTSFAFTEPTYSAHVTADVESGIKAALGGNLGLPAAYWSSLWAEVSNDLARVQAGALRNVRNRGAASYWALPSEAVLAASQAIIDEGTRKLSQVRLEQAKQQAVFAREDFWQAVQQGIALETLWVGFHQKMADRALAAAEQTYLARVAVHNANLTRFNALLEGARLDGSLQDLKVQRLLKGFAAELQLVSAELERDGALVKRWQGEWSGYQIDKTVHIAAIGEQIKQWNSVVDADTKYQTLTQEKSRLDIANYSAVLAKIDAVSRATATLLGARVQSATYTLSGQEAQFEREVKINAQRTEIARLTQSAQEAAARIDVAQAQFQQTQSTALLEAIATNAFNLSSTLVAASHVALGADVADHYTTNASRNAEKVW